MSNILLEASLNKSFSNGGTGVTREEARVGEREELLKSRGQPSALTRSRAAPFTPLRSVFGQDFANLAHCYQTFHGGLIIST